MKRLLPTLCLLLVATAAAAQTPAWRSRPHELRLTAGAFPLIPYMIDWGCDADFPSGFDRTYRGPVFTAGAWSLSYDYRFRKWFDAGLVLGFYGEYGYSYRFSYRDEAWACVGRNYDFCFTVMPLVRFTWVNTDWVRMYSALGLGATFGFGYEAREAVRTREMSAAFQCTPVGLAVGRSLFGFTEIGFGAQGTLMVGVGYKFKPKR